MIKKVQNIWNKFNKQKKIARVNEKIRSSMQVPEYITKEAIYVLLWNAFFPKELSLKNKCKTQSFFNPSITEQWVAHDSRD